MLNVKDKMFLVIGGGQIAERKVEKLLKKDASVMVISPELTGTLQHYVSEKRIIHKRKKYRSNDLKYDAFVIAATNDKKTNEAIAAEAKKKKRWINVVSSERKSNFIFPATINRNTFNISISTDGRSPALSKKIKNLLEEHLKCPD